MNFFDLLLAKKLGGGGALPTETATVTPTTSEQTVTPTAGHTLSSVTVNAIPSEYVIPTGTKQITQNGTGIDVSQYASADVAVPMPDEYAVGGSLLDKSAVEIHFASAASIVQTIQAFPDLEAVYFSTFSSELTAIPMYAFLNCPKLKTISPGIPNSVQSIQNQAFRYDESLQLNSLPTSLTSVGQQAFDGCKSVSFSTIPSGLDTIAMSGFNNCENVTFDTLPVGYTYINNATFGKCKKIPSLTFMGDITNVNPWCFQDCISCRFFDFRHNTSVPVLSNVNSFSGCSNFQIIVPDALVTQWKAATNWASFVDNIIGATDYDNQ